MSAEPEIVEEVDPSFEPKIIADIRLYRDHKREAGQWKGATVPLFSFEVDALLAAVDERNALKRELAETPDDRRGDVLDAAVRYAETWRAEGAEVFGPGIILDLVGMVRQGWKPAELAETPEPPRA